MELNLIEEYFAKQDEPKKSVFLFLRQHFLRIPNMEERYSYSLPFYYYKKRPFCYLYYDKKTDIPYIGFNRANLIDHPLLDQGNRKKMKVLHINPNEDIPIESINEIIDLLISLYK